MATQTPHSGITDEPKKDGVAGNANNNVNPDSANDITPQESQLLDDAGTNEPGDDDDRLSDSHLDDTDADGDKLNEADDLTGEDLDIPGSETDDADESIGEEDEENNSYSNSDQDDDGDDAVL